MNKHPIDWLLSLLMMLALTGCHGIAKPWPGSMMDFTPEMALANQLRQDREAILKMAGTFKVTFDFEETLPLQEGYALAKPYSTSAEELVVVVENAERFVSLQHLLVVRHEGETHVINHWRQDWVYQPVRSFGYNGDGSYRFYGCDWKHLYGHWNQLVYNVADSPRYAAHGQWKHRAGFSKWISSDDFLRPKPLRDMQRDDYNVLRGKHSITVTDFGWVHGQDNVKDKLGTKQATANTVVAIEQGTNRYTRVPDENFEDAHDYWKNTEPFWKEVRSVWAEVFDENDRLTLAKRWKGDPLFSHLFGLADEYWGQADVSEARPRIEEVIEAFVVEDDARKN